MSFSAATFATHDNKNADTAKTVLEKTKFSMTLNIKSLFVQSFLCPN
jgi:hypothetical protein